MLLKRIKYTFIILLITLAYNCESYVITPPDTPRETNIFLNRGLQNIGNSCYINSVLQIFASLDYYEGVFDYDGPNDNVAKLAKVGKDIINSLKKGSKVGVTTLNDFHALLRMNEWDKGFAEQDAQEFLGYIINLMINTNRFNISTPQYLSKQGNEFDFLSDPNPYFLPIGVDSISENIQSLIDNYFKVGTIKYKESYNLAKNKLAKPYDVMPIHLNLFDYNNNNNNDPSNLLKTVNKVNDFLSFEISPDKIKSSSATEPFVYKLVAFIAHHGKILNSGHYTACVKEADGEWYHYDDSHVNKISETRVNDYAKSAYLLFYKTGA